jgi:hypothetical protein
MYKNKKIFSLVIEDINSRNNNNTEFLHSSGFTLLKNVYSLPEACQNPQDFDNYCASESIKIPKRVSYRHNDPYQSNYLSFSDITETSGVKSCMRPYGQHFIRNYHHSSDVNTKIFAHAALTNLNYNWETHSQILNTTKLIPILVDPESPAHKNLYQKYLFLKHSEIEKINQCTPSMKLWSEEEIIFVVWKNYNYNYDIEGVGKIFSNFSFEIFDHLKNSILNYSQETQTFTEVSIPFKDYELNISNNRGYWRIPNHNKFNLTYKINLNPALDISFFKNTESEPLFSDLVSSHPLKRLNVIKAPSWKTKSSDKEISFTTYTKNQCLKRHASFMGFLNFQTYLKDKETPETLKTFNLVSSSDEMDLTTCSRAIKKLFELVEIFLWKDGVKLTNPQRVQEIFQEMYNGLNVYSDECCNKLDQSTIEQMLAINLAKPKTFNSNFNKTLTVEPKVDFDLKNKFNKIDLLYNENLSNIYSSDFQMTVDNTRYSYNDFVNLKNRINSAKSLFNERINELCNSIKNIYNAANFIKYNKGIHLTIKNKFLQSLNSSIESSTYSTDDFFNNLAKDNIHITSISYAFNEVCETLNSSSSQQDFISFSTRKITDSSSLQIESVDFVINRPVKIRIDSKEKYVIGGPYKVRCSKQFIKIALLAKESLFGIKEDHYCIHPHTSTYSSINSLFNYSNGCLGEATSLLYNAFEKSDLKLIILSAMTWVSSANSSDPWGKKYDWFPEFNSLKTESHEETQAIESSQELTENDVESFLSNVCEENFDDDVIEPFVPPVDLIDQEEQQLLEALEDEGLLQQNNEEDLPIPTPSPNLVQPTAWNPNEFSAPQENYVPAFTQNNINS